jgi:hypothetical protein
MKYIKWLVPAVLLAVAAAHQRPPNATIQHWQTLEANIDVPPAVASILSKACKNCHSNETAWPWYGRMIERDVKRARAAMNFSTWASGPGRNARVAAATLAAACADIRSDRMPLAPYRLMHPESRLSRADKKVFCDWANGSSSELLSRGLRVEP